MNPIGRPCCRRWLLPAALALTASLTACGDDDGTPAPEPGATGVNDESGNVDNQTTQVDPGVEGSNLGNLDGQAPYNPSDDQVGADD